MDLFDAISGRRSTREFSTQTPSEESLTRTVEAAAMAPSAANRQDWIFTVVRDRALLDDISRRAKEYMTAERPLQLPEQLYEKLADKEFHVFYRAPALIVISGPASGPWSAEDCALAAENLMLAAHGLGLGSCWIGLSQPWLATAEGKRSLRLPDTHGPIAPIIVGYASAPPAPVPRKTPDIRWIG